MINFKCQCGKSYSVKDELAGRTANCQQCGQKIIVPLPNPLNESNPFTAVSQTPNLSHQSPDQQSQPIVVVQESQALAAIMSFFFGGIGQLIQGRAATGLLWLFNDIILGGILLLMTFGLGLVFIFTSRVLCVVDAAVYKPRSGKGLGKFVIIDLCLYGGGLLCTLLFWVLVFLGFVIPFFPNPSSNNGGNKPPQETVTVTQETVTVSPSDNSSVTPQNPTNHSVTNQSHFGDIFTAVRYGTVEDVKYHIENGANVNAKDSRGWTPLYEAASKTNIEVVKFLVSQGADIDVKTNDFTPLGMAVSNDNVEVAKFLVSQGADVNVKHFTGGTMLHDAASNKNDEIAQWLVSQGADVNAKDKNGYTPLHSVANVNVAKFLLSKGADIHAKSNIGGTPLHSAAYDKNVEVVQFIVSQGANVNAKNQRDETPLHSAARNNRQVGVVNFLISAGADVNAKDIEGCTPLHLAAGYYSWDIMKLLVAQGADVNVKDNKNKTPLDWAKEKRRPDVINYLISVGAT